MRHKITLILYFVFDWVKIGAEYYSEDNVTSVFEFFKQKYDKKYRDEKEESLALRNFVTHVNEVEDLNAKATDGKSLYVLNKFADVDPEEYEQKHAVSVSPCKFTGKVKFLFLDDNVLGNNMKDEYLRQEKVKNKGNVQLYNLDDAEELYKDYLTKDNKTEPEGKTKKLKNYLRFVKTLVEINRNHFEGNMTLNLDDKADIIKEPNKFFF